MQEEYEVFQFYLINISFFNQTYEAEGMEYPPSDREIPPSHQQTRPSTIMKPTISQSIKIVKPQKNLKENLSKQMNSLPPKSSIFYLLFLKF